MIHCSANVLTLIFVFAEDAIKQFFAFKVDAYVPNEMRQNEEYKGAPEAGKETF